MTRDFISVPSSKKVLPTSLLICEIFIGLITYESSR